MKMERLVTPVAVLALILAGWCAYENCKLRARLDQLAADLHPLMRRDGLERPSTNLDTRLKSLEAAAPSPGLFMSAIQLHFAKLYFAGEARNWELAGFERAEILEHLEVVAALRPEERGVSISGIMEAFKNTPMVSLKDAIEMKDRSLFREAYRECLAMCNSCHQATGRPFITITMPTNPPVSNQRWELPADGAK